MEPDRDTVPADSPADTAPPAPGAEALFGLSDTHVVALDADGCIAPARLHPRTCEAFAALRRDACAAGFDLRVASGFRSFERQLLIWNGKARGERELLDADERPLDPHALSERARLYAILRWSALPGTSRHHWGSDADVVDAAALVEGAGVPLRVDACVGHGPFAALHRWLDGRIAAGRAHGFFRPYTGRGCAVAAEPWHLSYAPLAAPCQAALDAAALRAVLRSAGLELLATVESQLGDILRRYVAVPAALYPPEWRRMLQDREAG